MADWNLELQGKPKNWGIIVVHTIVAVYSSSVEQNRLKRFKKTSLQKLEKNSYCTGMVRYTDGYKGVYYYCKVTALWNFSHMFVHGSYAFAMFPPMRCASVRYLEM